MCLRTMRDKTERFLPSKPTIINMQIDKEIFRLFLLEYVASIPFFSISLRKLKHNL